MPVDPSRVIRDPHGSAQGLADTQRVLAEEQARLDSTHRRGGRAIGPYAPRPPGPGAGDPVSPSANLVAFEELDADLQAQINAGGQLLEVTLTFPDIVPPGVAINVQDGTYPGGGPATISGDAAPGGGPIPGAIISLSPSGVQFEEDGRIEVTLNGIEQPRGAGLGMGSAQWVSSTQLALDKTIFPGNKLTVRGPIVPPSPDAV